MAMEEKRKKRERNGRVNPVEIRKRNFRFNGISTLVPY